MIGLCCRYVLNYLPFGVAYEACNLLPMKLVIVTVREVYRVRQIHAGFMYASTKFPNSAIVVAVYAITLGTTPGLGMRAVLSSCLPKAKDESLLSLLFLPSLPVDVRTFFLRFLNIFLTF